MLKSIATVALKGALQEKLKAIAAAGFKAVEIFENDLVTGDLSPAEAARMLADHGLDCICFQPFRDFEGLQGALRARAFERARRKFELMNALGTDLMLVCSSVMAEASGEIERLAADFHELGDLAAAHGVRVGYEALAWGRHVFDHRQAWEVVQKADHPSIGLILDSFHSLARNVPTQSISAMDGKKIFLVQIADAPAIPMDLLYWSRHFRCFPGQGDFDLTAYVAQILKTGYKGPLSLEIFNDRFRAWSAPQIAEDGWRSLVNLEDQIARRMGPRADLQALPERVRSSGFTFLEFAAHGPEADELQGLFRALGFTPTGQHRTKQVTRWSQGGINLVLNQEPTGFAHSHAVTHGASVCAIGLGARDFASVTARAEAMGMHPFDQASGPGELQIPALRGVGGSLISFTPPEPGPDFWETDFAPLAEEAGAGAGLKTIDHVAQSMPLEEFLSWQLYYTSLLAVERMPTVDIPDPSGLIQSQAIQSDDGKVRFTLNGGGGQTLASRFVHNYFGAGIQHIAFSTDDIFATAAALKAGGVALLPLHANYYEDLASRFDMTPEFLARLQDNNILYDRDAFGDYLQIYTRAFHRRFFFEVVQRGGYKGYGAVNAPARLAAQARVGASPTSAP